VRREDGQKSREREEQRCEWRLMHKRLNNCPKQARSSSTTLANQRLIRSISVPTDLCAFEGLSTVN
jgi:hypothetical protein